MHSPCRDCMERTKDAALCRTKCPVLDAFKAWLMQVDTIHKAIDPDGDDYSIIY